MAVLIIMIVVIISKSVVSQNITLYTLKICIFFNYTSIKPEKENKSY
jgi:hypothetical protein